MADIYFKCACNKCMAVDQRGQQLPVACPDCGDENIVPAADIAWDCPGCGDELSAPAAMINAKVQCVNCRETASVPKPGLLEMTALLTTVWLRRIGGGLTTARNKAVGDRHAPDTDAQKREAGRVCHQCHAGNLPDAAFCCRCGQSLDAAIHPRADRKPVKLVVKRPPHSRRDPLPASGCAYKRRTPIILKKAAALLMLAGIGFAAWHFRADLQELWERHEPRVMAFLDRANIYRPAPVKDQSAAPATPAPIAKTEMSPSRTLPEPARPVIEQPVYPERTPVRESGFTAAKRELADQNAFFKLREAREAQRRKLVEQIKTMQARMHEYADTHPGDFTASDGTAYRNITVTRLEPDGISILHAGGAGKIRFREMPADVAARFGYDPEAAATYERAATDTRELNSMLAEVEKSVDVDMAAAALTAAMREYPLAASMNQADDRLEKLLVIRAQNIMLSETMAHASTLPAERARMALREALQDCPRATNRHKASRMLAELR